MPKDAPARKLMEQEKPCASDAECPAPTGSFWRAARLEVRGLVLLFLNYNHLCEFTILKCGSSTVSLRMKEYPLGVTKTGLRLVHKIAKKRKFLHKKRTFECVATNQIRSALRIVNGWGRRWELDSCSTLPPQPRRQFQCMFLFYRCVMRLIRCAVRVFHGIRMLCMLSWKYRNAHGSCCWTRLAKTIV